jgi:hypothetical protein
MPRKEDRSHSPEQPIAPYILASRYDDEPQARLAYMQIQDTIAQNECDLSAYRLMLEEHSFVAVLGDAPNLDLDAHIQQILATGTFWTLPVDVISTLSKRRASLSHEGPWVEGHHQPGHRIRRDLPKQSS